MAKGEYPYCRSCGQAITEGDTGMGDNAYVHAKVKFDPEENNYYLNDNDSMDDDHDARPDMMHGTLQLKQFGKR